MDTTPLVKRPPTKKFQILRIVGIVQIIVGVLTVACGITAVLATDKFWVTKTGAGVWGGVFIVISGITGVCCVNRANDIAASSGRINWLVLTAIANIFASIIALLDGIFFVLALVYYIHCDFWETTKHWIPPSYKQVYFYRYRYNNYYHTSFLVTASRWTYIAGRWAKETLHVTCKNQYQGIGVYAPLVLFMVVGFIAALVSAVVCFKIGPCSVQDGEQSRLIDENSTRRNVYVEGESDVPYQKVDY